MERVSESFHELIAALRKCRQGCPWTRKQSVESYGRELLSEAEELKQALERHDYQNLREELGDVLWDVLMVAHFAEDAGHFTVDEIMRSVVEKMKRRKPYVFEGREVSLEEAHRLWKEAKKQERLGKGGSAPPPD